MSFIKDMFIKAAKDAIMKEVKKLMEGSKLSPELQAVLLADIQKILDRNIK